MNWTSVKDKLPEIPQNKHAVHVLITAIDVSYYVTTVLYKKQEGFVTSAYGNNDIIEIPFIDKVTHWMYLPEPPDYEEGEACDL